MAKFDLNIGASVHCKDGQCGTLSRVVIDPHTQRVTDLVVEKGFLLKTDRVLPIEAVERASDRDVYVQVEEDDLEQYPEYDEAEFAAPAPGSQSRGYAQGDMQCWRSGYKTVCDEPVVPMVRREIQEGVSPEMAVVERGTKVKTAQGAIGEVDHLLVDPESGNVTHLVMRRGLIPYYPVIPVSEIESVTDQVVTVGFDQDRINEFPRYKSRSANDVRAELMDRLEDEEFDVEQIEVTVEGGIVRLQGWVPDVSAKRRVEAVTRSTVGVVDVENELDTNVSVATRVRHALFTNSRTSLSAIEVVNEQGVITLKGNVDSAEVRDAAEEIASEQEGVISVTNALEVQPDEDTDLLKARWVAYGRWSQGGLRRPQ